MKLYEYYKLITRTDGKRYFKVVADPMPDDGFAHEPLSYVDPDGDEIEEEAGLPFRGTIINFAGDKDTAEFIEENSIFNADDLREEEIRHDGYYYRTGVYHQNEDHTGYDAVLWVLPDPEFSY